MDPYNDLHHLPNKACVGRGTEEFHININVGWALGVFVNLDKICNRKLPHYSYSSVEDLE